MRLPAWDELAAEPEQLEVLEYPIDQSLFVVGPPGSGKTVLAVQRAKLAAQVGDVSSVAIVTFNRMLRRQLTLLREDGSEEPLDDGGSGPEASTMHSFVSKDYWRRTSSWPPNVPHDQYTYDWEAMSETLREHAHASPNKEHLVVDEGQDLPEGFFQYADRYVSKAMTVFADEDQALGERRTTLEQIKQATGLSDPIILTRNHRNTPEIARLAEHFHGGRLPAAKVLRPLSEQLPRLIRSENLELTTQLVSNWCETRGDRVGVIVNCNLTGHDLHDRLSGILSNRRVDIYQSALKNEESIDLVAPGVTILNKESAKGQEFDTVFVLELEDFIPCTTETERRAMYMMCTRARDNLFLVYSPANMSPTVAAALPGPDILERS